MISGVGIDTVKFSRIEEGIKCVGEPYLSRVFTPDERRAAHEQPNPVAWLSGRFAVKEATFKALNLPEGFPFKMLDVETLSDAAGRPIITLYGELQKLASSKTDFILHVSISYESDCAYAVVLAETA